MLRDEADNKLELYGKKGGNGHHVGQVQCPWSNARGGAAGYGSVTLQPSMALDLTEQRQHAHAYLDRLPAGQLTAVRGLLESMLSPLDRKLALAPLDDEPVTLTESAAIDAGIASLESNGGVPLEKVLSDFGLTMEDFRGMAETALPEESGGNV